MSTWMNVGICDEPYGLGSTTFVSWLTDFPASGLGMSSPTSDPMSQSHFWRTRGNLTDHLGTFFVWFCGHRRRMGRGCMEHTVAAGLVKRAHNGPGGIVEWITLRLGSNGPTS